MKSINNIIKGIAFLLILSACSSDEPVPPVPTPPPTPDADNGGINLPAGFGALIVASDLGTARHIAVHQNGDIFVKLGALKDGYGILRLRDTDGDGKSDSVWEFGNYAGTGIYIKGNYLYASSNTNIYRYTINEKQEIADADAPTVIVRDMVNMIQHNSKSLVLDNAGYIYVNIGAPSNACQIQDRTAGSPGEFPCSLLETAGGIWRFKANQVNQSYAAGVRYGTGIRNVVGLDWNTQLDALYVMQHGRDDLHRLFGQFYTEEQSANLPAEELLQVDQGDDFGWPYCYYDPFQQKRMLSPEYGGDGQTAGDCATAERPVYAFPAHWAPNGLLFYTGNMFPEKYKNGAFVAFHGSWNRSPLEQTGYNVVFLPFSNGSPSGEYEIFANGFIGTTSILDPADAKYRPCGLAQGPDGSLYISDDVKGTIWRVVYTGN